MKEFYRIGVFFFTIQKDEFQTYSSISISMWEDGFPARLYKVRIKVMPAESVDDIVIKKSNQMFEMYTQRSDLNKNVGKLLALDDLRKDIYYGVSSLPERERSAGLADTVSELEKISILIAFLFSKLVGDIGSVRKEIEGLDDPDVGYKLDKLSLIEDLFQTYCKT